MQNPVNESINLQEQRLHLNQTTDNNRIIFLLYKTPNPIPSTHQYIKKQIPIIPRLKYPNPQNKLFHRRDSNKLATPDYNTNLRLISICVRITRREEISGGIRNLIHIFGKKITSKVISD